MTLLNELDVAQNDLWMYYCSLTLTEQLLITCKFCLVLELNLVGCKDVLKGKLAHIMSLS